MNTSDVEKNPLNDFDRAYHYVECGLDNVWLDGLEVTIDDSGEEVITIPNAFALHREIARALCFDQEGLSGPELRFLRTEMGMTQKELAAAVKTTNVSVSRWENGTSPIDPNTITVIKLIAVDRLGLGKLGKVLKRMTSGTDGLLQGGNLIVNANDTDHYRCEVQPIAA